MYRILGMVALLLVCAWALPAAAACPPAQYDLPRLRALKAGGFAVEDDAARNALARALVDCLSASDPELRDGIGFEAYFAWLRADRIDLATRRDLLQRLLARLSDSDDPQGVARPFAVLVLAEVLRTDRLAPWMEDGERARLFDAGADYLSGVRDYRGFDPALGWRHGVAHAADLMTQFAVHPSTDRARLDRLLGAIASQVRPRDMAYTHGESERLARPVLFAAQRALHTEAEWKAWIDALAAPAPLASWDAAWRSADGIAHRHNLRAFLLALYYGAQEGGDERFQRLLPAVRDALRAMP
jgi:hypothetical protein